MGDSPDMLCKVLKPKKIPKKTAEKLWPQCAFQTVWVCVPIYRSSHNTSLGWNLEQLVKTFIDDSRQKYFLIYNLYLQLCRLYFYATKMHLYRCHKYLKVSERMCCEYKFPLSLHLQICPRDLDGMNLLCPQKNCTKNLLLLKKQKFQTQIPILNCLNDL